MAARTGRKLRIKLGDGASTESFTAIVGAREDSFSGETGEIDVTDKDDGTTRELIEGGIQTLTLSISGVAKDDTLFQKWRDGTIDNYQVEWADTGATLECAFQVGSYSENGNYDNEAVTFEAEMRSSGAYTYTPGP